MSGANIKAITALFPHKGASGTPKADTDQRQGAIEFDQLPDRVKGKLAFLNNPPNALEPDAAKLRKLFKGDLSDYATEFNEGRSEADMAFCSLLVRRGLSVDELDMALRASGLYREKWERADYRGSTIGKAMEEFEHDEHGSANEGGEEAPARQKLDLAQGRLGFSTEPPPPRDWALGELVLAAKTALLAGFGGVSKTQLVIQLAICIVLGIPFMGKAVKRGRVLMFLGEEDRAEIRRRVNAYIRHRRMTPEQIQLINENLLGFGMVGEDARLTRKLMGALEITSFGGEIIDAANELGGVVLIVLDHAALIHGGDFNAREDVAQTMVVVNGIAQQTGAAVVLLAHSPKSARGDDKSDSSQVAGSTAFVDQARAVLMMAGMRPEEAKALGISKDMQSGYVSLACTKNNYGPTGDVFWFRRVSKDGVGLLEHVELTKPAPVPKGTGGLEARVVAFIKAHPGQFAKTKLRDTHFGVDGPLKSTKQELSTALENLLADGRLVNREPTPEERQKFDLGKQVKQVLEVAE